MQQEQRNYLKERLSSGRAYEKSPYGSDNGAKPPEVLQAEKTIERWQNAQLKLAKAFNVKIRKRYNAVRETIMGDDYAKALKVVQEFERTTEAQE